MSGATATRPDRREQQRFRALEHAQQMRLARAELRRKLQRGEIYAASVLLETPVEARTWAVGDLIARQRGWGNVTCRKLLARLQIPAAKPVAELTDRQRSELVQGLGGRRAR